MQDGCCPRYRCCGLLCFSKGGRPNIYPVLFAFLNLWSWHSSIKLGSSFLFFEPRQTFVTASTDRMRQKWHCLTPEAFVTKDNQPIQLSPASFWLGTQVQLYWSHSAGARLWRDCADTEILPRSTCFCSPSLAVFQLRPQTLWSGDKPSLLRSAWIPDPQTPHKKWLFDAIKFWGNCYTTTVTGTDASSEPISMVKEERRNQKADGGCSYGYPAIRWPNWMTDSGKQKLPNG